MEIDKRVSKIVQKRLGYSDEEMSLFQENPRNADIISKGASLGNKRIVLKVVESHGCNSRHQVGDKFYFDAFGNLLTELCPKQVCGYSLNAALMMVFTANEMMYAGVDPNQIRFKRAGCFDVGLQCGGWGRIVLELEMEEQDGIESG
ncbi:MAG: TIGR04076 family protein [Chloroflexi bacterium]|nr:TIGR04076 family protein [Chloroflexota bacterium]